MGTLNIEDLNLNLKKYRVWLMIYDLWNIWQTWFWLVGAGLVGVEIAGRLWPISIINKLQIGVIFLWGIMILVVLGSQYTNLIQTAQRVDLTLGLKERLSTAIALETGRNEFSPVLVERQKIDANQIVRSIEIKKGFPLKFDWKKIGKGLIIFLVLFLSQFIPNPQDIVIADRENVAQVAKREAEKVNNLREQLAESENISPDELEKLLKELTELAEKLRDNPGDRSDALADISKLEELLLKRTDPSMVQRKAMLDSLASQLASLDTNENPTADLAESLKSLLDKLPEMAKDERETIAQNMAQMAAQASKAGDPNLAQALSGLAQAFQSGDNQAASSSSQSVNGAVSQAQQDLNDQVAIQNVLSQLQSSQQAMSQAGQQMAGAVDGNSGNGNQSSNNSQGNGQNSNQGKNQGQNQGQGQGNQAGSGGGSKANTLPPFTGSGAAQDPLGEGQSTGVRQFSSEVYVPVEQRPGEGDVLSIGGEDTGQGTTQVKEDRNPLPGTINPVLIPYQEVYSNYVEAANQAVEESDIPLSLRDYIKAYFSQLEP